MNRGIDYGMGRTNVDQKTGIRFGVIPQFEVLQAWADSSEPYYGEEPLEEDVEQEPISWVVNEGGYKAECGSDGDIFILKSPYYTRAQFCSPCAPGACYLMCPTSEGERAYCFGHDWFEGGKAPYPVFRVDDDEEVKP